MKEKAAESFLQNTEFQNREVGKSSEFKMDNLAQEEPPDAYPATKLGAAPGNPVDAESEVATPRSGEKRAVELLDGDVQGGATRPKSPRMHVHAGVEDHLREDIGDTVESFEDEFENSETGDEAIPHSELGRSMESRRYRWCKTGRPWLECRRERSS